MQKGHLSLCVSARIKIHRPSAKFELEHYPSFQNLKHLLLDKTENSLVKNISSKEQEVKL